MFAKNLHFVARRYLWNRNQNMYCIMLCFCAKIMKICSCCTKSFKQRLYIKAEEIYENEMDITYILKKIQDIEKLKLVLLNPKQLSLFNLLAKALI